jgi:hypothetical protein
MSKLVRLHLSALATLAISFAVAAPASGDEQSGDRPDYTPPRVSQGMLDAAVAREQDAWREGRSPLAAQHRAASRASFKRLNRAQAFRTLRDNALGVLDRPVRKALELPGKQRVVKYLGSRAALITDAQGNAVRGLAVESNAPIATSDGKAIDVRLRDTGGTRFEAINPLSPIAVAKTVGQSTSLSKAGVGFRFVSSVPERPLAILEDRAVADNVARDTDLIIAADPAGAEASNVLRSPDAPEDLAYEFQMPASAKFVERDDGSWAISAGTKLLAVVSKPRAWDADGTPVTVATSVDGSVLTMHVTHRQADLHYPITVDPMVGDGFGWYPYGENDTDGWAAVNQWGQNYGFLWNYDAWYGHGMYIFNNDASHKWFDADHYGAFRYYAPGNSQIVAVAWDWMHSESDLPAMCTVLGVSRTEGGWENGTPMVNCNQQWGSPYSAWRTCLDGGTYPDCSWAGGHPYNIAWFQAYPNGSGNRNFTNFMGQAEIKVRDDEGPTFDQLRPTGWFDPSITGSTAVHARAIDLGFGMRDASMAIATADGRTWDKPVSGTTAHCGSNGLRCDPVYLDTTLGNLPEGLNHVTLIGRDAALTSSTDTSWDIKIDRTPPELTLTGALADQDGKTVPAGSYGLHVDAQEGESEAAHQSGITNIEINVEGVGNVFQRVVPCPQGDCQLDADWTFNTADFSAGEHTITVSARDGSYHWTSETLTINTACCARQSATWGTVGTLDQIAYGDVNGDSKADLVSRATTGSVAVRLSTGSAFGSSQTWGTSPTAVNPPTQILSGDVDGDGDADLAFDSPLAGTNTGVRNIYVSLSTGQSFGAPQLWTTWPNATDVHLADIDSDGLADLVGYNATTGKVVSAYSVGDDFVAQGLWETGLTGRQDFIGDADGDGMADVVLFDPNGHGLSLSRSDSGDFTGAQSWGTLASGTPVGVAEVNGDSFADLVVTDSAGASTQVLASDGSAFSAPTGWGLTPPASIDEQLPDVDGDGQGDFVFRNAAGSVITALGAPMATYHEVADFVPDPDVPYFDDDLSDLADAGSGFRATSSPAQALGWGDDSQFHNDYNETRFDRSARRVKQAGARTLRMNVYWKQYKASLAPPAAGYRNDLENAIKHAKGQGLKVYMTLTGASYDPGGASNLDPDPAAFASFVSDAVTEFSDPSMGVVRYGIWNEPNNAAYLKMTCPDHNPLGGTTPGLYRQLYIAGYNALKAANPNAKAFVGELSELPNTGRPGCQGTKKKGLNAIDYLAAVANDANAPILTDGVAWHPYQHRRAPATSRGIANPDTNVVGIGRIGAIKGRIETLYDHHLLKVPTSQQNGEAPQLYFTEFGYLNRPFTRNGSTHSYHTEKERASWYPRALSLALRNHVKMFLLWETTEEPPSNATLNAAENYPNGATAFDTGVIGTNGAVTGTRPYGKGGPQARRAYCAIRKWARSAHYSTLASTSDDPDKC